MGSLSRRAFLTTHPGPPTGLPGYQDLGIQGVAKLSPEGTTETIIRVGNYMDAVLGGAQGENVSTQVNFGTHWSWVKDKHTFEFGGEFEDPGDILTVDIDPTTGEVAQPTTVNIRHELFIKGTEPVAKPVTTTEQEAPAVPQPDPLPATTPTPRPVVQQMANLTAAATVSLEVCPVTGLLPQPGVCPTSVNRSFPAGKEPRITCRQSYHTSRPRVIGAGQQ